MKKILILPAHTIVACMVAILLLGMAVKVNAQCTAPSAGTISRCTGDALQVTAYGSNVTDMRWYTVASGGTYIGGVTVTNPSANVWVSTYGTFTSNVTYYVSAVCGGTESTRAQVNFTAGASGSISISPSVSPTGACESPGITLTGSGGTGYQWRYNSATGSVVSTSATYSPTASGTYYLTGNTSSGCGAGSSQTVSLPVTITPKQPSTPVFSSGPTALCTSSTGTSTYAATATNASTYTWSIANAGTSTINSSGVVTWNWGSFSGTTPRITVVATGCDGTSTSTSYRDVTVTPVPVAPQATNYTSNCSNNVIRLQATSTQQGVSHTWYTTPTGSTTEASSVLNTSPYVTYIDKTFSATTSYYVSASNSCGESVRTTITVTFTPAPSISIASSASPSAVCQGSGFTLTASGGTGYSWGLNSPGSTVSTATVYAPTYTGSNTYYLTGTNSCGTSQTASIVVNMIAISSPASLSISTGSSENCAGTPVNFGTVAVSPGANPVYQWKIDGQNAGTGSSLSYGFASGVHQVYCVLQASNDLCFSTPSNSTATSNIIIVSVSGMPTVTGTTTLCGAGNAINVTAPDGSLCNWYASTNGSTVLQTGNSLIQANTGDFTYYVSAYDRVGNCETSRIPVVAKIYPQLAALTVNGNAFPIINQAYTYTVSGATGAFTWLVPQGSTILSGQGTVNLSLQPGSISDYLIALNSSNQCAAMYVNPLIVNQEREETILISGITDATVIPTLPVESRVSKGDFFDGLGRHLQQVVWQQSPAKKDMAQPLAYDQYNRTAVNYLPYAAATNDGKYKPAWTGEQAQFYQVAAKTAHDNYPYAQTVFEPSPLNRVSEQGAPGTDWQPTATSHHTNRYVYDVNAAADNIRKWAYDYTTGLCSSAAVYPVALLSEKLATDENGYRSWVYTDSENKVICKIQEESAGNLVTYYIYDDFDKLRITIPPMGTDELATAGSWSPNQAFLDKWCFQYQYDQKRRIVQSKVPGAAWVYTIYDDRDRPVLTQDGNQRVTNQWMFTKHDVYNRPVSMGVFTYSGGVMSQSAMQSVVDGVYSSGTPRSYSVARVAASDGYTDESFPTALDGSVNYLTYTYYDDYGFKSTWNGSTTTYDFVPELGNSTNFDRLINKVTGVKVKVLNDNTWLKTVNYYDDRGRMIQTVADNYTATGAGGIDRNTTQYDFAGRVLSTQLTHTGIENITVLTNNVYDHASRITDVYHTMNAGTRIQLAHYEYNELGQLVDKKLHANPCSGTALTVTDAGCMALTATQSITFGLGFSYVATSAGASFTAVLSTAGGTNTWLQSVDYRYNIRGWNTSINNSSLTGDGGLTNDDSNDLWGTEFKYNNPVIGATAQYNGNIAEMLWSQTNLNLTGTVGYQFTYDPLNRLTNAAFTTKSGTAWTTSNNYNETPAYDKNGNILTLNRYAYLSPATPQQRIDNLTYTYNGNQLLKVADGETYVGGFTDGTNTGNDYAYDINGNMTADLNKTLSVTYNYLNLPQTETIGGNIITYTYDAIGRKWKKAVTGSINSVMIYDGPLQFSNSTGNIVLDFVQTTEGRIVKNNGLWSYQYFLKDHLGNMRMSFDNTGNGGTAHPLQEISYYPFGYIASKWGANDNKYLYNGKELQEETQLYDYITRQYDPITGRWVQMEPKADIYHLYSPYTYVYNRPINAVDPDGRDGILITFPDYKIDTEIPGIGKVGGIGHAGILLIDNKTGDTKYYEYGRYPTNDGTKGVVKNRKISNVVIGKDGLPTSKSLAKVLAKISEVSGHNGRIVGAYYKSNNYKAMLDYARKKFNETNSKQPGYNKDRESYSLPDNNCITFACDVLEEDDEIEDDVPNASYRTPNTVANLAQNSTSSITYNPVGNTLGGTIYATSGQTTNSSSSDKKAKYHLNKEDPGQPIKK